MSDAPRKHVRLPIGRGSLVTTTPSVRRDVTVLDASGAHTATDRLAVEEPLEIRVAGEPLAVTMRTPGHDEELAAGFLFTEGVVPDRGALEHVAHWHDASGRVLPDVLEVQLRAGAKVDVSRARRAFYAASSCGVCGKATIDSLRTKVGALTRELDPSVFSRALLDAMPAAMRPAQQTFDDTGGLHAAALFARDGTLVVLREDVGRHNATDKVIGHMLLSGRSLAGHALLVSGRAGFEIVQKAAVARIPLLAAISAPSSLAVDLSVELGVTLVGFLRPPRAVVYGHAWRITSAHPA
jgi:FdhD protein